MPSVPQLRDIPPVHVPASATTHKGFRAWAVSEQFPEQGRISYIDRGVLIDMGPEELETHNQIKTVVGSTVFLVVQELDLGKFYSDRMLLTNEAAELSTEPDGTFVTWETLRSGRVRLIPREGHPGEYVEMEGTPDWVLEVVSRSSVQKDNELLLKAYHQAGIPEYWLIEGLGDEIDFRILRRGTEKYEPAPPSVGWHPSQVLGRSFRLERRRDPLGYWQYFLRVRED